MLLVYTIVYILSICLYYMKLNGIASGLMITLAIFLYIIEYRKKHRIININGLFALGFIGGFGISLLKLSKLSSDYSIVTIITIYVAFFSLYIGSYFCSKNDGFVPSKNNTNYQVSDKVQERLLIFLARLCFISFIVEAAILGFIPIFTIATPHAYSTFHVYMLHYITSLYVFIPPISIANYFLNKSKRSKVIIALSFVYVVIVAIMMISRAQLIMSIVLSIFVILMYRVLNLKKIRKEYIVLGIVLLFLFLGVYVFITINRAHSIDYLNGIFEMKNESMPIVITQPYMYIAHNFENLNYMINTIFRFGFGRRILTPLFTLTFIKKMFPIVADAPIFIIKEELSTKTLIYDFYYDFGILGVICMCAILGYIGKYLEDRTYNLIESNSFYKNNYIVVLFSLFSYYMLFSFFQTYFSLTDTWVHLIILSFICLFVPVITRENKL